MFSRKHKKLLRKFAGNLARPRFGWKKEFTQAAKFFYLLFEWPFEIVGDLIFWKRRREKAAIRDPRRILIVKIDQFGDVLFSTFLLPIIKAKYPDAEIDYLINPKTKPLLERNPHIKNTYFWEDVFLLALMGREKARSGTFREVRKRNRETIQLLRARRYDVVLNARAYPPSSNIPWRRLGAPLVAFDISEQSYLADYWANYDLDDEEWKNYLNLLQPLGINTASADFREEFYAFGANPMEGKGKYVAVSPVSFDPEREWSKSKWRELLGALVRRGFAVAITGTKEQEGYIREIAGGHEGNIFIFAALSLADFGALMKGAEFFVGIDSFPAHLALACRKRAFVFVNSGIYFLKGHTPKRFWTDARIMLPVVGETKFFEVSRASARDVERSLPE